MTVQTPIDPEALKAMTDTELAELHEHLEAMRREHVRSRFTNFARAMEVPGTPVKGVKHSDFRRQLAIEKGEILDDDEPDAEEFYPTLLDPARHHDIIMDTIQDVVEERRHTPSGDVYDGVMIFCPPGAAKSTYASMLAPAYFMGKFANFNVIGASYAQMVSDRFSRRTRSIVESPTYRQLMGTSIRDGNAGVQNWTLDNGSEFRSAGVQGAVTSFRADLLLIDDPVAGREEADSEVIRDKTYQAYEDDLSTRLKPGGKIGLILTRWHEDDVAGRILGPLWKGQSGHWKGSDGRNWLVINIPMVCEHADDPLGRKVGPALNDNTRLWPEWFRLRDVERLQAQGGRTWTALYQQRPAAGDGVILLRDYWRKWPSATPPECEFVYLTYDTAIEDGQEDDPSAMTAWGVFETNVKSTWTAREFRHKNIIMLGAWSDRVKAVDLAGVIEQHLGQMKPDLVLIEKRASGHQLIQELRRKRYPVKAWLPPGPPGAKGKVPRAHAVTFVFEQGAVHYMDGPMTQAVIDQCASFPYGQNDDLVDTVTMAVSWLRHHYLVEVPDDEMDDEELEEHEKALNEARWEKGRRRLYG